MDQILFKDYGKIVFRTPLYSRLSLFGQHNETKNLEEIVAFTLRTLSIQVKD